MLSRINRSPLASRNQTEKLYDFPFLLVLVFLFFDYGRPQSLVPGLASLHIPMFIQILLGLTLLFRNKLFDVKNAQTKCFIGLVALMALHVPIAFNNYYAYQMTRGITLYLIVYLSIVNFVDSYSKIVKFIEAWIIINTVCAVIGLAHGGRIIGSGFMGDENDFALVMNMAIPFAYFMFLETDSLRKKVFYLLTVGLFIAANVASSSRGGFVGLVPVIGYCWYKTSKKALATVLIVMMLGILLVFATQRYWDEMETIKEEKINRGTGRARWYYWKVGWRMFFDHPVMGIGPGNFGPQFSNYVLPHDSYRFYADDPLRSWGRVAHSIYFTVIPELGLIGIFLFGGMLYYTRKDKKWILNLKKMLEASLPKNFDDRIDDQTAFVHEVHKLKFIIFGINGALLGYLVSGIFLSVLYYPHFWILTAISVASKNVVEQRVQELQCHGQERTS